MRWLPTRKSYWRLALSLVTFLPSFALAQIVPDGGTATTATTNAGGQITVGINPNLDGNISHNTYSEFSVPTPGVILDNTTTNAITIVNEVTSTRRSQLNGPLTIKGAPAHVIIANPNGVTVDGGTFINTGGVAIGAGSVNIVTETGGGISRREVVLSSSANGDILVEGDGLSGAMPRLHLLARTLQIDAPVESTYSLYSDMQLTAGASKTQFSASSVPLDSFLDWASVTQTGGTTTDILVDITPRGSLSASQIGIQVTEDGAGVSFAGKGLTSVDDLVINAKGHTTFTGAQITAESNIKVVSDSIEIVNSPDLQTNLEAVNRAVTLIAQNGDLTNLGGAVIGKVRNKRDAESRGAVTLEASGSIDWRSESPDRLAIGFGSDDGLYVRAGGDITNIAGRLLSNGFTHVVSDNGDINNIVEIVSYGDTRGQYSISERKAERLWYTLWTKRKKIRSVQVDYGDLAVPEELAYIVGASVQIDALNGDILNSGGEIDANSGNLDINTNTFTNAGEITGEYAFREVCSWYCRGSGGGQINISGGRVNAADTLTINADTAIYNHAGQILAVNDVNFNTPIFEAKGATVANAIKRPNTLLGLFHRNSAWFLEEKAGGLVFSLEGAINISDAQAVLIDASLDAAAGINVPGGIVETTTPNEANFTRYYSIGVLWKLFED